MGKARKAKIDQRGPLQRALDAERGSVRVINGVAEYHDAAPLVNEFAERQGEYERHNGKMMNRGGTPLARWDAAGLISDSQMAAIKHCLNLWEIVSSSGSLVANLDKTIFGCPGDGHPREYEARSDLVRMKGHVGETYWSVFESVVRFDEPAGVAGSKLASNKRSSIDAARFCVCFVADIIAMRERLSY